MNDFIAKIPSIVNLFLGLAILGVSLFAAGHALLNKRHAPASLGWVYVCLLLPGFGAAIYFLFGINRITAKVGKLIPTFDQTAATTPSSLNTPYLELAKFGDTVTGIPLTSGNLVSPLFNGEEAFPSMLEEIHRAKQTINLSTYIFETNQVGRSFVNALRTAKSVGVTIRTMVDGVGELYSWPRASSLLKKSGIACKRFIPPRLVPPSLHINLRNHRKILTVDGEVAFTGGMNLGDRSLRQRKRKSCSDIHFRLTGPIVSQLDRVFLQDWQFVSGDTVIPPIPDKSYRGPMICRTIVDGPDRDLFKLQLILQAAILTAQTRVCIMTPYFLPPHEIIAALQTAALKGIDVDIILPQKNNLPYVNWATEHMIWQLLDHGVNVYYQPPPFAHTKLLLIDNQYTLIGTANIDARSLRLNFEVAVEVYSEEFTNILMTHYDDIKTMSKPLTAQSTRSLPIRLRNGLAWLAAPYL